MEEPRSGLFGSAGNRARTAGHNDLRSHARSMTSSLRATTAGLSRPPRTARGSSRRASGQHRPKPPRGSSGGIGTKHKKPDISFLEDTAAAKSALAVDNPVPPSTIPPQHSVANNLPAVTGRADGAQYDPDSKQWRTQVFPSTRPAGRRDVQLLEEWLDERLKELAATELDVEPYEHVQRTQNVYNQCYGELCRQVSVNCAPRGALMKRVWDYYAELMAAVVRRSDHEQSYYESVMRTTIEERKFEVGDLREQHKEEMDEVVDLCQSLRETVVRLQRALKASEDDARRNKRLMTKADEDFTRIRSMLRDSEQQNKALEDQNEDLQNELVRLRREKKDFEVEAQSKLVLSQRRVQEVVRRLKRAVRRGAKDDELDAMAVAQPDDKTLQGPAGVQHSLLWCDRGVQTDESATELAWHMANTQKDHKKLEENLQVESDAMSKAKKVMRMLKRTATAGSSNALDITSLLEESRNLRSAGKSAADLLAGSSRDELAMAVKSMLKQELEGQVKPRNYTRMYIEQIYHEKIMQDAVDPGTVGMKNDSKSRDFILKTVKPSISLPDFTQEFYLDKYGIPRLANEHLLDLLLSVQHFPDDIVMKTFRRLYSQRQSDALAFFLYAMSYLENHVVVLVMDEDDDMMASILTKPNAIAAMDYLFPSLEATVRRSMMNELDQIVDPKSFTVGLHEFLWLLLDEFDKESRRSTEQLRELFIAGDVNSDDVLSFDEFVDLVKHIRNDISDRQLLIMFREALAMTNDVHASDIDVDIFVKLMKRHNLGYKERPVLEPLAGEKLAENTKKLFLHDWKHMEPLVKKSLSVLELNLHTPREVIEKVQARLAKLTQSLTTLDTEDANAVWTHYRLLIGDVNQALSKYADPAFASPFARSVKIEKKKSSQRLPGPV